MVTKRPKSGSKSTKPRQKATAAGKKSKVTRKQAEEQLTYRGQRVTEDDVRKVLDKQADIEATFGGEGPLARFVEAAKLLFSIVHDYANGKYRKVPFWTIAAIVAALLYVLNPVDLIPDFIPVIGYVDDAFVVAACLAMVEQDLRTYKEWKMSQE